MINSAPFDQSIVRGPDMSTLNDVRVTSRSADFGEKNAIPVSLNRNRSQEQGFKYKTNWCLLQKCKLKGASRVRVPLLLLSFYDP